MFLFGLLGVSRAGKDCFSDLSIDLRYWGLRVSCVGDWAAGILWFGTMYSAWGTVITSFVKMRHFTIFLVDPYNILVSG